MSFTNFTNGADAAETKKEHFFIDLVLPLLVWTGLGISEVILCSLVLIAIIINKSLHDVQHFLIANLMVCDLVSSFTVNFVVTGTSANSMIDQESKGANCSAVGVLYFPFTASFIMVTMLIFDRFVCIIYPMKYIGTMTFRVAVVMVAVSWILGFIFNSFALYDPELEGQYTRNGYCHTRTVLSRIIGIVIPNVVATLLGIIQIMYLAKIAHKVAKERQKRQSVGTEKNKKMALSGKAIRTLFLLVGMAGLLGVVIPIMLGFTRAFVGNETAAARAIQNGVVPFFGKMPTTAHSLLYGFYLSDIRSAIAKMLRQVICYNRRSRRISPL